MAFTRETVERLSSERSEPTWLCEARLQAWQRFEATPMPNSAKDEDWRRTDISKLDLSSFTPSLDGANTPVLTPSPAVAGEGGGEGTLPLGVIFTTLEQAVKDHPDLVREHLSDQDGKFLSLNAALWAGGAFVYVPPDVQLALPLVASFGEGAEAVFPRTLIVVDRGASLVYIDCFAGAGASILGLK
ncbi:MAG TPA: hypothetical protein VMV93_09805, partial [Chloroflexota bacterium]|nr:hypothetical protein [Chloroflexota bacterium]